MGNANLKLCMDKHRSKSKYLSFRNIDKDAQVLFYLEDILCAVNHYIRLKDNNSLVKETPVPHSIFIKGGKRWREIYHFYIRKIVA